MHPIGAIGFFRFSREDLQCILSGGVSTFQTVFSQSVFSRRVFRLSCLQFLVCCLFVHSQPSLFIVCSGECVNMTLAHLHRLQCTVHSAHMHRDLVCRSLSTTNTTSVTQSFIALILYGLRSAYILIPDINNMN